MPKIKSQEMKSIKTKELQPDKMSSKIHLIIMLDIAGKTGKEISGEVNLCESRVSIIRNSPMYIAERARKWKELEEQVLSKQSNIIVKDPAAEKLRQLKLKAVELYEAGLNSGSVNAVTKSIADSVLDRTGLKAKGEKSTVSVEVTEKMADRFERVLSRKPRAFRQLESSSNNRILNELEESDESNKSDGNVRQTKITIKKELSS